MIFMGMVIIRFLEHTAGNIRSAQNGMEIYALQK